MIHLLKLEWLKQKEYILFKILTIAYFVFLPAILMIGKKIQIPAGELPFDPQKVLYYFPSVWEWLAYIGNWLVFFIFGFMAVLLITNEHSYRTMRQNVIAGMQRSSWFWSKALFIIAISFGATLYYALCSISIGLIHGIGDSIYLSTVFMNSGISIRFFLMCLGYMGFGMLIGILVKRTGIALFAFLGYCFFLEPVLRWVLHMRVFKHESMNYYPINIFEDLCPVPFAEMTDGFTNELGFKMFVDPSLAIVLATGYILLFGWIGFRRLKNVDL